MNPKFSIITPCYNSEKTIERTINSVLNQTYKNYEYIIIDGGSTDKTLEIIEKYKKNFNNNILIISEPDNGIYDAMNKGIDKATGELIGIVNSDDFYEKDALENISKEYCKNKYQIIYGGMRIINEKEEELSIVFYHHRNLKKQMINHPTTFVSKKLYDDFGKYSLKYKSASDFDFMLRMNNNNKVEFVPTHKIISNFSAGGMSSTSIGALESNNILYKNKIINWKKYMMTKIKFAIKRMMGE